jgi:hypothetical protein
MLYLGMAGRTGELAEEFFVVRCRQRKAGDKRSGAADLVTRTTVVAGLFGESYVCCMVDSVAPSMAF